MANFKYLKFSKLKKLRYINYNKNLKSIWCFFMDLCQILKVKNQKISSNIVKKKILGFLGLEYSGHGKSSGDFTKGNISKWSHEVKYSIKKIIRKKNFILVGSSMGSWLSLNQFKYFHKQILGFLGIGSAPEFLELLMWKKFSKKIKSEIQKKGIYQLKHGNYEYPITYQLIKDGRKNKVLNKKINLNIYVTMVHGTKDEVVPVNFSRKVLRLFKSKNKRMIIIKNGDHSLSNKKNLKKLTLN